MLYLAAARRIERVLVASMASPMRSSFVSFLRALILPMALVKGGVVCLVWGSPGWGPAPLYTCTITQFPPLVEPQYHPVAPLSYTTCITTTQKVFPVSFTIPQQAVITKYADRRTASPLSQIRSDSGIFNRLCAFKIRNNFKACSSLCSHAIDKRSIHLDGDIFCCGGLNGVRRVRFRL
ncbi:hypothetical protein FN846DRAFT_524322 [Sphaerosporella brunnea]|uniref:Uncharacterized protein n=1 Tax=Sphaerosporella brunnea TaxID=1250544 RepID=A0A5J5ED35_9PEZI|nr:hypothetical protein FN846DRAFT_524322 [Sphaerosporella brunnea]